jgi:hypothetical protein
MTARVVGVDGSPTAQAALAWSLGVAACYGAQVEAVQVWRWPLPESAPTVPDLPAELVPTARSVVEAQL